MQSDKVRDACVSWAEVEYRHADSFTRTDLALSVAAWRVARKAALQEVLEEVERRHAMAWDEYKVQFLGSHSEGQADALDSLSSFIESMAKELQ